MFEAGDLCLADSSRELARRLGYLIVAGDVDYDTYEEFDEEFERFRKDPEVFKAAEQGLLFGCVVADISDDTTDVVIMHDSESCEEYLIYCVSGKIHFFYPSF